MDFSPVSWSSILDSKGLHADFWNILSISPFSLILGLAHSSSLCLEWFSSLCRLLFPMLWSRTRLHTESQRAHRMRHPGFPSFSGVTISRWLVANIETHLFPILCTDMCCLWQEGYSKTSFSVTTGSRSELPINFNFPLILPPETYHKTVFYSLLYILLSFFFLNPPSAPYHLPKYLAFKVLINTRN